MILLVRKEQGVSLLELLVATALFSLALLFILDIVPRIKHSVAVSQQYRRATVLAENQMELLHEVDLAGMAGKGTRPLMSEAGSLKSLPAAEGTFEVEKDQAGYRVALEIGWGSGRGRHHYQLHTILSDRMQ